LTSLSVDVFGAVERRTLSAVIPKTN
jgi:hypothetical protein